MRVGVRMRSVQVWSVSVPESRLLLAESLTQSSHLIALLSSEST